MKAAASSVSGSVTGSRLMISRPTGTSYWIDTPRSPRTAWASQSTYWTTRGRSSPSDVRSRAVASGLPSVPMMTCAGSPGRTRITTKTRRDTTKRVATNAATLLLRYCRTCQPDVTWPAPTTPRKDPPTVSGGPSTIPAHPSWPLGPLGLLEASLDAGLGQLPGDDLARPHRVVVHRRDLQRGLEAVREPRLGQQALGPRDVVGHRPREVDVVRVQWIDVRAEELAH